jgi:hypothetical protein
MTKILSVWTAKVKMNLASVQGGKLRTGKMKILRLVFFILRVYVLCMLYLEFINCYHFSFQGKTVMRVRVKENSPPGTYVTTIKAVNSNSASVSFELEDNRNNIFWIDPSTGIILVKGRGMLDREQKSSHEILVKAQNLVSNESILIA